VSFELPFDPVGQAAQPILLANVDANFEAIAEFLNGQVFAGFQTVFQATDAAYGLSPSNTGAQNDVALQAVITAALAGNGGIIFIPAGSYTFQNGVNITGTQKGLIIQGAGAYTQLLQANLSNNIFNVTNFSNGSHDGAGLRFRNLWIEYTSASSGAAGTAIALSNTQNVTVEECIFWNCPQVITDDFHSLQCGLKGCTIYNKNAANCTQVTFAGNQDFCHDTVILGAGGGTVAGQIGMMLVGVKEFYCDNSQISQFIMGVTMTTGGSGPTLHGVYFSNCFIPAYMNGVTIIPATNAQTMNEIHFSNCTFQSSNGVTGSSGVYVDTNGGNLTNVQGIIFDNCCSIGWGDAGVRINVASMVEFIGGIYSSNGLAPSAVTNGAGIALTGACDNIRIHSAILDGIFAWLGSTQPYGVALSGGCTDVWITGNSIFANQTSPFLLSGQGQHCFAKDNRGYNNINPVVAQVIPSSTTWFDGLGFGSISPSSWTVPFLGDYLVTAVGSGIFASYISHDRSDLTKVSLGLTGQVCAHMNAQQSMRLDYTGPASAIIFNILGQ
jgi:hypothetical protein